MTEAADPRREERLVLRGGGSWWLFGVSAAVAAFLLGDAIVRGDGLVVARALPWIALALWLIWIVLVRPCVVITRQRLEIVNVWRRHLVPWDRIDHLTSRYQLRAHLDDGRSLRSWGAPTASIDRAPRTASDLAGTPAAGRGRSRAALPPVDVVIERWRSAAADRDDRAGRATSPSGGAVESRIDVWILAVTAALVVAVVVDVLV